MSVTIALLSGLPVIKVTGEVGAFLDHSVLERPDVEYHIALSDGTLLKGTVGGGIVVKVAGRLPAVIVDGIITIDGDVQWVALPDFNVATGGETAEFRKSVPEGLVSVDGVAPA